MHTPDVAQLPTEEALKEPGKTSHSCSGKRLFTDFLANCKSCWEREALMSTVIWESGKCKPFHKDPWRGWCHVFPWVANCLTHQPSPRRAFTHSCEGRPQQRWSACTVLTDIKKENEALGREPKLGLLHNGPDSNVYRTEAQNPVRISPTEPWSEANLGTHVFMLLWIAWWAAHHVKWCRDIQVLGLTIMAHQNAGQRLRLIQTDYWEPWQAHKSQFQKLFSLCHRERGDLRGKCLDWKHPLISESMSQSWKKWEWSAQPDSCLKIVLFILTKHCLYILVPSGPHIRKPKTPPKTAV